MKRALVAGVSATSLIVGLVAAGQLGATAAPRTDAAARASHGMGLDIAAVRAAGTVKTPKTFGNLQYPALRGGLAAPESVDLSTKGVAPGDQGKVGSCVAWATGYSAYGILMGQGGIPNGPMAPMYLYSQLSGGVDRGSFAGKALPMLQQQGIDTKAHYSKGDFDYRSMPNAEERANAAKYKLSGFQQLPTGSGAKQAIMDALAAGMPVAMGFTVRSNFNSISASTAANYSYQPSGGSVGGHEVTIVGYTSQGVKVQNSWGTSWGAQGFYTLPWSYFNGGDVLDLYSMGKVNYTGGGPTPTPPGPQPGPTPPGPDPMPTPPGPQPPVPTPPGPDPMPTPPGPQPGPAPAPGQAIMQVTSANLAQAKAVAQQRPVVFLVTAPSWCGACKVLEPIITKIANAGGGKWTLAVIDTDRSGGAEREFGASGLPTMIGYGKNGPMSSPQRMVGAGSEAQVQAWVDSVIQAWGPVNPDPQPGPTPPGPDPMPTPPGPQPPVPTPPSPDPGPGPQPVPTPPGPDPMPTPPGPDPMPTPPVPTPPVPTPPGPQPGPTPPNPGPTPTPQPTDDDPWWWFWYILNGGNVNAVPAQMLQQLPQSQIDKAPASVKRKIERRLAYLRSIGAIR